MMIHLNQLVIKLAVVKNLATLRLPRDTIMQTRNVKY
jgi:hypothetical protein